MEGALPLGTIPGIEFPAIHLQLSEDDSVMPTTNGIADTQDAEGHLFGFERISSLLRERDTASPRATDDQNFGEEDEITVLTVSRAMSAAA
jgi:serine phosphatase RsbU (regulator of sigma subunit)